LLRIIRSGRSEGATEDESADQQSGTMLHETPCELVPDTRSVRHLTMSLRLAFGCG
jgi:hypothetical protein